MLTFLYAIVLVALFASFIILFLTKIGFIYKVQQNSIKVISKLFSCQFCLSFWTAVVLVICLCLFLAVPFYFLFIPIFSTPITRILL